MDKVIRMSIKKVASLLQKGEIDATDLTTACLDRVKKIKDLNAYITVTENTALSHSVQSVNRHKHKRPSSEFLDGIPIAIKDNFCTAGIKTTCASRMLQNFIPTYSATVYEKLRIAGAVLIGKANMDEFAMGSGNVDSVYGPTKNVWGYKEKSNDFYIAGGSSGGCATAVASYSCFAAIGSDTGGSVRIPASYCGLVGLKPTYGFLSRLGLIALSESMDTPGIITRKVDDCVAVLNIIAGFDKKDSTSRTHRFTKIRLPPGNQLRVKNLKIGIPKEYYNEHLSKEVFDTWNEVAHVLASNGAIIKEISLPHTEHSIVCYSIINQCEVSSNLARYDGIEFGFRALEGKTTEELFSNTRFLGFNNVARNRIIGGNYFLLARNREKYFDKALKVRRLIVNDFDKVFEDVHFLLAPTTLSTAPLYSDFVSKTNRAQCAVQDFCTTPVNLAGLPAVAVPIKRSSTNGMPLSIQLIGRNLNEMVLLAVAKFIERHVQFSKNI